jgi:hypothetical protein
MRLTIARFRTFLLLSTLTSLRMEAQSTLKDTVISDSAYPVALRDYHTYVEPEVGLYRGNQYADYDFTVQQGQPFFGPDSIRTGSVWYNGVHYLHVRMLYDEVKQQVVIQDPFRVYKICLWMDFVDSFELDGHYLGRIGDTLAPAWLRTGYYEKLYQGRIVLLKRERKYLRENLVLTSDGVRNYIDSSVSYYLKRDGAYHGFNNKREVYDLLKDRRADLKKLIRKYKLSWRRDRERILVTAVSWYDGANH